MKQQVKRMLALVCVAAIVLAAFAPSVAHAAEADEPGDYYVEIEAISDDLPPYEEETQGITMPKGFSSITVREETFFSFTPNVTGYWTFVTSNRTDDAFPFLRITNHYGHVMATDWGSGPDNNAIVKLHLVEGASYVVQAGFDWGAGGRYTLSVFVSEEFVRPERYVALPEEIPGEGGEVSGYERIFYSFVPDTTGFWGFNATSDGWYLELTVADSRGNLIVISLDDMELDFSASALLVAGQTYVINGWVSWDAAYTLSVRPMDTFEPWIDWDLLAQWDINLDLSAVRTVIPSTGGENLVETATHFSFSPETSGLWTFDITDGDFDVLVIITDSYGSTITPAESGWWNDRITMYLLEDVEYVIWLSSFWSNNFFMNLVIGPYEEMEWDEWDELDTDWDDDMEWGNRIPSTGGYFSLDYENWFLFTPEITSSWTIAISSAGHGWNDLSVSDASGSFWISEWDTGTISMHMAAGVMYTIDAWSSWDSIGAVLQVSPTYELRPHGEARILRRVVQESEFSFIPSETGYWIISTSNALGATDPFLWLLDAEGNVIAQDDDGGDGLNALIKIYLEAGTEYVIRAGFFAGGGEYTLNIRLAAGEQVGSELVELVPPRFV